jgi:hypothetical protein
MLSKAGTRMAKTSRRFSRSPMVKSDMEPIRRSTALADAIFMG